MRIRRRIAEGERTSVVDAAVEPDDDVLSYDALEECAGPWQLRRRVLLAMLHLPLLVLLLVAGAAVLAVRGGLRVRHACSLPK